MWLLLLFVVVPAVELYLLVRVGSHIGVLATIGLILITGMLGWMLVRSQGISTLRRIREQTAAGQLPAVEMVSGLCLLAAGLLLITPGFLTDTVGFLMLIPPLRRLVARRLIRRFKVTVVPTGGISYSDQTDGPDSAPGRGRGQGVVIDLPPEDARTVDPAEGAGRRDAPATGSSSDPRPGNGVHGR